MKQIDHITATDQNEFTEGNPSTGTPATRIEAEWLNVLQEEIVNAVEAGGQTLDQTGAARNQLLLSIQQMIADVDAGVPVGGMIWWPTITAPTGFLVRDGALISRTTYADLFAIIGTDFGAGDGSTTFQLPDDRGQFLRGFDDGAGVDSGRVFGSLQDDAFQGHHHEFHWRQPNTFQSGSNTDFRMDGTRTSQNDDTVLDPVTDGTNGTPRTDDETRPKNRAYLPIIKF